MLLSAFINLGLEKRKKSENHTLEQHRGYSHVARGLEDRRAVGDLAEHNILKCQELSSPPVCFLPLKRHFSQGTVSIRKEKLTLCVCPTDHGRERAIICKMF